MKAHVGRWSEDCPEHQGVVVLGMDDTPLVSELWCHPEVVIEERSLWTYRVSVSQQDRQLRQEGLSQRALCVLGRRMLGSISEK